MKKYKILFMGTPDFAVPALERLIKAGYKILAALTAPDKPVGRKQIISPPPVKKLALEHKIPVFQPEKLKEIKEKISDLEPDLIVVVAFGKIIPKEILEIPKYGSLNIHPSLLPKYRGPSPIQFAILNGEKITGTTIMLMDEKMDHGPILAQEKIAVEPKETSQTLHQKLSRLGADLLLKTILLYLSDKIKPKPQDEKKATYTKILTREDGKVDWQKSAREIERQIRAFFPWPGAWTIFNGKRLKILKARVPTPRIYAENRDSRIGEIFAGDKEKMAVKTGKGSLLLETVQPQGKKPMSGEEFMRGYYKGNTPGAAPSAPAEAAGADGAAPSVCSQTS